MIKVYTKKNGQVIESLVEKSVRPKPTPEMCAEINQTIKERKKLVTNRAKRKAVINLAKSNALSFIDALLVINQAEEKFVQTKEQGKPASKVKGAKTKKSEPRLHSHSAIFITEKVKPKVVSGGLPTLGKRK
jgi:hypothetical protein